MPRGGVRYGDVKKDLSHEQLAGIGAVAISFNDLEFELDVLLAMALAAPDPLLMDVAKRVKGLEDRVDLAKMAIDHWQNLANFVNAPTDYRFDAVAKASLGAFSQQKKYRDLIVHSRVYHNSDKIGEMINYKGSHEQVLLSEAALEWVYQINLALTAELNLIRHYVRYISYSLIYDGGHFPTNMQLDPEALSLLDKARHHQRSRASLGPAPKFPDEALT